MPPKYTWYQQQWALGCAADPRFAPELIVSAMLASFGSINLVSMWDNPGMVRYKLRQEEMFVCMLSSVTVPTYVFLD